MAVAYIHSQLALRRDFLVRHHCIIKGGTIREKREDRFFFIRILLYYFHFQKDLKLKLTHVCIRDLNVSKTIYETDRLNIFFSLSIKF